MTVVAKALRNGGWKVRDVSSQKLGWDLEATGRARNVRRIEVKGSSGKRLAFIMTRQELTCWMAGETEVALVPDALSPRARPRWFGVEVAKNGAAVEPMSYRVKVHATRRGGRKH